MVFQLIPLAGLGAMGLGWATGKIAQSTGDNALNEAAIIAKGVERDVAAIHKRYVEKLEWLRRRLNTFSTSIDAALLQTPAPLVPRNAPLPQRLSNLWEVLCKNWAFTAPAKTNDKVWAFSTSELGWMRNAAMLNRQHPTAGGIAAGVLYAKKGIDYANECFAYKARVEAWAAERRIKSRETLNTLINDCEDLERNFDEAITSQLHDVLSNPDERERADGLEIMRHFSQMVRAKAEELSANGG